MPQKLRSQTPYNSRNRETHASTSRTRRTQKPPKSKPFRRVCWSKITKKRGTRSSYVTSNKNPSKKHSENFSEIPRKGSENQQKERTGTTHPSLEEPRRIIYTSQGLACARSSFPLIKSHHEALKLVLWKS
jgi:hypothetical protein